MWTASRTWPLIAAGLLSAPASAPADPGDSARALYHQRLPLASAERHDPDGWHVLGITPACPLLLHLWAPWCRPCVQELPQLGPLWQRALQRTPAAQLAYAALDSRVAVERFLAAHPQDLPPTSGRYRLEATLQHTLSVPLPATLLLDGQGQVRHAYVGTLQGPDVQTELLEDLDRLAQACAGTPAPTPTPLPSFTTSEGRDRAERALLHRRLVIPALRAPWGGAPVLPRATLRLVLLHQEPQRCPGCIADHAALTQLLQAQSRQFKVVLLRGSSEPPPSESLYQLAYAIPPGTPAGQVALLVDEQDLVRHAILGPLRERLGELHTAMARLLARTGRR